MRGEQNKRAPEPALRVELLANYDVWNIPLPEVRSADNPELSAMWIAPKTRWLRGNSQTGERRGRVRAEAEARAVDWNPTWRKTPGVHPRSLQCWKTRSESSRKRRSVDSKSNIQYKKTYTKLILSLCSSMVISIGQFVMSASHGVPWLVPVSGTADSLPSVWSSGEKP